MVFARLERWFGITGLRERSPTPRTPLAGRVRVGEQEWAVREERRAGPQPQLLILTLPDEAGSKMHLRFSEGQEVHSLEDIDGRADWPSERSFPDIAGALWEARLVLTDDAGRRRIKFIRWPDAHEGPYPFEDGLGRRNDDELRAMLDGLRAAAHSK